MTLQDVLGARRPFDKFSGLRLLREGLRGHSRWRPFWSGAGPKAAYDVVLVGGGGHGLATAYYLARTRPDLKIAVLERAWLGGGNTGRNTTVIRSNYIFPESAAFYDQSVRMYEGLSAELNFNVMFSQRGVVTIAHTPHDLDSIGYWASAMRVNGVDTELLSASEVHNAVPLLNKDARARFPVLGGMIQRRAGVARHDAVAWAYARAAHALGVDIVQNCEVTGVDVRGGYVRGLETTLGAINVEKVGLAAAGATADLARLVGLELPMNAYTLQAYVSEPVKPVLHTVALSLANGVYVSQSDKGEIVVGGALDLYASRSQRGSFHIAENVLAALVDMYPALGRLRLLRMWGGTVDVVHDSSPIFGLTAVKGLYVNCGWGTGGFKAIPAGGLCFAHTIAEDAPHPLTRAFGLERFLSGAMIDEAAASGIAH